jgi:hypothetical protein
MSVIPRRPTDRADLIALIQEDTGYFYRIWMGYIAAMMQTALLKYSQWSHYLVNIGAAGTWQEDGERDAG